MRGLRCSNKRVPLLAIDRPEFVDCDAGRGSIGHQWLLGQHAICVQANLQMEHLWERFSLRYVLPMAVERAAIKLNELTMRGNGAIPPWAVLIRSSYHLRVALSTDLEAGKTFSSPFCRSCVKYRQALYWS